MNTSHNHRVTPWQKIGKQIAPIRWQPNRHTLIALCTLYFLIIRPWQLRWGATDEEVACRLPGDDIVKRPHFIATRAVTIQAPPAEVWPWLLQIGSARGGWYSLDRLDNGGQPSTWEILPAFQKIEKDYFVPFTPNQKNGMWVKEFSQFAHILWWDKQGKATWGWYLEEIADQQTRLISRLRTTYDFRFPWVIYYFIYDFGDIVMMRKCLLGIKARAEAHYQPEITQSRSSSGQVISLGDK